MVCAMGLAMDLAVDLAMDFAIGSGTALGHRGNLTVDIGSRPWADYIPGDDRR
jgi:hypothetical protein